DTVNLNTLNESVYYQVMAVDHNQNHSSLSSMLRVSLPDLVPPQPPVFHPVHSDEGGVTLSWVNSASEDVIQYALYRKSVKESKWKNIAMIRRHDDDTLKYTDKTGEG